MTGDPVAAWKAGTISAEVALARLLLRGGDIAGEIGGVPELRRLFDAHRMNLAPVRAMLAGVDHRASAGVACVAAMFDAAVAQAPEASVAVYSLGDPATLARATGEIVAWLAKLSLIGPWCDALDLGCGIGRIAGALAPLCHSVLGVDASAGMIAEARKRHRAANIRLEQTSGETVPDGRYHLVLAVDTMPYLLQAGVAERHVGDAARALHPGGALCVLNLSYGDMQSDRATAQRWAHEHSLALLYCGVAPFDVWDGAAFLFRRVT